jgi:Common central domain of tyrosinase
MLGDGIRRNIATVSKEERDRYVAAVLKLDDQSDPNWKYSDGVTFFDKQQWVHYAGHGSGGHGGILGLQWHRELCNRYEALLRAVDPQLSLHYWDWTTDPRAQIDGNGNPLNLLSSAFIGDDGSAGLNRVAADGGGDVGAPFANFETTVDGTVVAGFAQHFPLADKPGHGFIWRNLASGGPVVSSNLADAIAEQAVLPDNILVGISDSLPQNQQFLGGPSGPTPTNTLVRAYFGCHNYIHKYIGGTFSIEHIASRDPIFFLIHSNLDRLWAMWQRVQGKSWRLDPNQIYGLWDTDPSVNTATMLPWNGSGGSFLGNQPLLPWVIGNHADDTSRDPGHAVVNKTAKDPTVVIPHSYDTAPHSSYIITNRDTFSTSEVSVTQNYPSAFFVIYEGFEPKEVTTDPTITFTNAQTGVPLTTVSAINPVVNLEDPGGATDVPQRITISYDIHFSNSSEFPTAAGGTLPVRMHAALSYTVDTGTGGTTVNVQETAEALLLLVNQPNPYMVDVEGGNPSWLSVDTRVFQIHTGGTLSGQTQGDADTDANAPYAFIQGLVASFNSLPNNSAHPFLALSSDEDASVLELSRSVNNQRVFNYAVAKVRYVAPATVDAANVSVFFRVFSTMVSALDYDSTSGATGNYRRAGSGGSAVPLLGIQGNEIASIPFFAAPRIDTAASSMTSQTDHVPTNTHTINGTGAEQVAYFGCWLDINLAPTDPHGLQFPLDPTSDPGGRDGPYSGSRQTIQTLIRGVHQCMVAEVFFEPAGTDPIPHGATPGSSDRLAQRNLAIVPSGNPGGPETHTIQHTFVLKPSFGLGRTIDDAPITTAATRRRRRTATEQVSVGPRFVGPDELMIRWNNIPRESEATFYLPEVDADEILALSELRQHPVALERVDAHTLRCRIADITFIPLPGGRTGSLAGLLTLTLPSIVKAGQRYKLSLQQFSGLSRKILGAFQITIPVRPDPELLASEMRKLSVLRYVQQSIPAENRWYSIFARYVDQIAARVRGFGGDPDAIEPSPDGGKEKECPSPKPRPVCPPDRLYLPIPWDDCELDGELELKLRFRRRCDS